MTVSYVYRPREEREPAWGYTHPLGAKGEGYIDAPITLPTHYDGPVIYKVLDADRALIYVGSTVDLRTRIYGHKTQPWRKSAAFVSWVRVPYAHMRDLEARLITKLRPPANVIYNPDVVNPNTARALRRLHEAQSRFGDRVAS